MNVENRSNKKRSAKLLRCFPHCCPGHIERSYCGCSVHVLVTFESVADAAKANANGELIVCARFEAATTVALPGAGDIVTALPVDSIMALPGSAIRTGVNTSKSDWVRGEKASDVHQQQFPENAILYVLNNDRNPQWYYGYESGSTKAQRELKHVLAAYMFQLHPLLDRNQSGDAEASISSPAARLATVVVRHASPSFTMISYRRLNDVRRSKKKLAAEQPGSAVVFSTPDFVNTIVNGVQAGPPVLSRLEPAQSLITLQEITAEQHQSESDTNQDPSTSFMGLQIQPASVEGMSISVVEVESSMSVPPLGLHSPRPTLCCPICCTPVNLQSHPLRCSLRNNTIDVLQSFLVIQLFMSSAPLATFSFHFDQMDIHIQRQWLSILSPFSRVHHHEIMEKPAAHQLVADITSMFSLSNCVPDSQQINVAVKDPVREQMVLQSCANMLLDVFSSTRQIVTAVDNNGRGDDAERILSLSESCEQFCQWIAEFIDELTQLLVARNTCNNPYHPNVGTEDFNAFPALVDEILSLIYGEAKYQSLRKPTSALLLHRDGSLEVAVQKLFWAFVEQKQHRLYNLKHAVDMRNQSPVSASSSLATHTAGDLSGGWNRRWFLEPPSVSVVPLSHSTGDSPLSSMPSLLSVATLLRMFASVDVSLHGFQFTIEAAITGILPAISGTQILLDRAVHSLDTLPSGLSTMAGAILLGECWSSNQYEGCRSDDGSSIDLLLFALPASPSNRTLETPSQRTLYREARRIRLQLNLDEVRGRDEDRFSVFAEVSSAQDILEHTVEHDFDSISSWGWSPVMEVHATYIGAATSFLATTST